MKRIIFNSKKLYTANLSVSSIFFLITVLGLYSVISDRNWTIELVLYLCYFVIYAGASAILLIKPKKAVISLNIIYFFAIIFNVIDFFIHYSRYDHLNRKYFFVIIIAVFTTLFSLLIYFNNKNRFYLNTSELDEIGKL